MPIDVLIVDDLDENLYLLKTILTHSGYNVKEAKHGEEALKSAAESPPDLIVSDILMPIMDGFALCRACKEDQNLKHIPFVFYTATYTEKKDADFALSLGANRFLVKPMESHHFLKEIVKVVEQQKSSGIIAPGETIEKSFDSDEEFYKMYNTRLIHKLEDKLVELEKQNGRLLEKEKIIQQLNTELEEKVDARTEELLVLNEDLASFNFSVSHDLRAPLRAILGYTDILQEDHQSSLNNEAKEFLNHIQHAGQRMEDIIQGLLRLSKIRTTGLDITHTNLSTIAENIVKQFDETEPNRQRDIFIQKDMYAYCDKNLMQIALENLLNNAWKYASKMKSTHISFGRKNEKNEHVFFIKDNGAGFNMKHESDLFEPFRRLHTENEFPGMGIGLATVKKIINHHNGKVWAEGKPQEGACFYFTLNANH